MCLLYGTKWVFISQKTAFVVVTSVETSNLLLLGQVLLFNSGFPRQFPFYELLNLAHLASGASTGSGKSKRQVSLSDPIQCALLWPRY
jgi:hypothetical protein